MNKQDRKRIEAALEKLEELRLEIDDLRDHEEMKVENLPDSLAESERASGMRDAAEALAEAVEYCESLRESLDSAICT